MNEDKQAAALGRWLDSGGQGHAPEGIDADVLEAIYAIKPELAPPASVSIDDILGDVTEGPFAQDMTPVGGEVVPFPVPTSRPHEDFADEDASTPDEASSKGPWWIRWGTGGVAGSLAAAAAVLLVVTSGDATMAPFDTTAASREMATSAREEMAASAREEMAASARRAKSERIAEAAAAAAAGSSAPASAKKVAPPPPPATAAAPVPESKKARPTPELGARNDAGLREQLALSGSAAGSQLPAEGDLDAIADAGDLANTGGWSDEAPGAEPMPELERADVEELQTGEVRNGLSELAYAEEVEEEDAVVMNEPLDQQVDAYGFADKGADLESFDDVAQAPSMATDRKTKRTRGYQSRPAKEEARDFDVSGDWRSTVEPSWLAQIEGRLRLAGQHAQRQEYQTAATTLEDFIRPPTRAGLAVAYTAANYGLQAGDVSYALDLTDRGLALGGAGTPEHDRLVALRARLRSKSATKTNAR
jgi:hypothetical protein